MNGLEKAMHLWLGNATDFTGIPADLLLANMHFQVIDQITDQENFYAHQYYLLSELLGHEGHRIGEKMNRKVALLDTHQENFWFTFLFKSQLF